MEILENKDYKIFIGEFAENLNNYRTTNKDKISSVFILTDENVFNNCMKMLNEKTDILADASIIKIKPGEEFKTLETATKIWQELLERNADRRSLLINFGGGVITDLGGFVAANFKRGIDFINIPTSLIAMADAAIGGKTGVDFQSFKNQIGVFNNPQNVYVNTKFLETLPDIHMKSGYAEVLKYCLLDDKSYWDIVKNESIDELKNWDTLVKLSLVVKNEVVSEDFQEKGIRKILNFGHTIGHAFETYSLERNMTLSHGHAVAIGILCESFISSELLSLSKQDFNDIVNTIKINFEKFEMKKSEIDVIIEIIKQDKKNIGNKFLFSLIDDIGKPDYNIEVSKSLIYKSIDFYLSI